MFERTLRRTAPAILIIAGVLVLGLAAIAAADPSDRGQERRSENAEGNGPRSNDEGIRENDNAREGSARGQNREGEPGAWKDNGHDPQGGGTQGKSPSDPDADGNGGMDKPGYDGGFDDDKDGNNGCGNDADREDDNNGWCGKRPKPPGGGDNPPGTPPVEPSPTEEPPLVIATPSAAADDSQEVERPREEPEVLGIITQRLTRPVEAPRPALATTGMDVTTLALAGLLLIGSGAGMRRKLRR